MLLEHLALEKIVTVRLVDTAPSLAGLLGCGRLLALVQG
jgi:hypothetical protein